MKESTPNKLLHWKWFKKDFPDRELSDTPSLDIQFATKADAATYVCTATNVMGTSDPVFITLSVVGKTVRGDQCDRVEPVLIYTPVGGKTFCDF